MSITLLSVVLFQFSRPPMDPSFQQLSCEPLSFAVNQALSGARLTSSSGDLRTDAYIASAFVKLADVTGLYPGVLFDSGSSTGKLFAVPPQPTPNNPDRWGRVILGTERLRKELHSSEHGIYGIVGAVAHEFGHVLQFHMQSGLLSSMFVCELHADFMAGYFLGKLFPDLTADRLTAFIRSAQVATDQVHGSPTEREQAILAGYLVRTMTPTDAFASGEIFLLTGSGPSAPADNQ